MAPNWFREIPTTVSPVTIVLKNICCHHLCKRKSARMSRILAGPKEKLKECQSGEIF
jgi:hypothetical protein